jgi:hypothetical protein
MKKIIVLALMFLGLAPVAQAQDWRQDCRRVFYDRPDLCVRPRHIDPYAGNRYFNSSYSSYGQRRGRRQTFLRRTGDRVVDTAATLGYEYGSSRIFVSREDKLSKIRVREAQGMANIDNRSVSEAYQEGMEDARRLSIDRNQRNKQHELEVREARLVREENVSCPSYGPGSAGKIRLHKDMPQAVTVTWGKYSGSVNELNFPSDNARDACVDVQPGMPVGTYHVALNKVLYICRAQFLHTDEITDTWRITEASDRRDCRAVAQ